jgi:hypothetical protein
MQTIWHAFPVLYGFIDSKLHAVFERMAKLWGMFYEMPTFMVAGIFPSFLVGKIATQP